MTDLYHDKYDVLVATAGSIVYMLNDSQLFLNMFSCMVLDEAHHAVGGKHPYSVLLGIFQRQHQEMRPRLLGLTASPFRARTVVSGSQKLKELTKLFQTSAILKPEAPRLNQENPQRYQVWPTEHQKNFQREVMRAYRNQALVVARHTRDQDLKLTIPKDSVQSLTYPEIGSCKGEINLIEDSLVGGEPELRKELQKLTALLEALDVVDAIGISSAVDLLEENQTSIDDQDAFRALPKASQSSSRLQTLRTLLNECQPDSKVLIFVNTRTTARRLESILQKEFPEFKPNQVVGHGGWDGQQWEGDQDEIIADFHTGKCRLLVSTAVLEEGIDVAACDLVVRYSGVNTLTQFIQSRGRARKDGSRFVLLVTDEDIAESKRIEEEEKIMDMILSSHNMDENLPSVQTRNIIKAIKENRRLEEDYEPVSKKPRFAHLPDHSLLEFYVPQAKHLTERDMKTRIEEVLEAVALDIGRIDCFSHGARKRSNCPLMFENEDHVVLCQVSKASGDESVSGYHNLATGWHYKFDDQPVGGHPVGLPCVSRILTKSTRNPMLEWTLSEVSAGSLTSRESFNQYYRFQDMHMTLTLSQTGHLLKLSIGQWRVELSLLKTSILGFGLASWQKSHCSLFIPLANLPNLFEEIETIVGTTIIRILEHPFLDALSTHSVMKIRIDFGADDEESAGWWMLRQIFSSPDIIPIPIFDTRVNESIIPHQEGPAGVESYNIEKINNLLFEEKRDLLHAEWSILQKKTDLEMNVPDDLANDNIKDVRERFLDGKQLEALKIATAWSLSTRLVWSFWKPMMFIQHQERLKVINLSESTLHHLSIPIPDNQSLLLQLVLTPARHIFRPPIPVFTSRLTRMLSKSHNLVVISFREENLQKLHDSGVYPKIRETLVEGINIMGRQFHFLCASASQIRDHKAFFVEVSCPSEVYSLRKLIIEDPNMFKVPAQYLSRIGLFCTADRPTIEISRTEIGNIEDKKADDSSLVTDGSGLIKRSKAEEVFKVLGDTTIPSAFQFRLGGLKGVLTVVDDIVVEQLGAGKSVLCRPSQKKFDSDHAMLGVVKRAEAHPLKLNREAITLLESWYVTAQEKDTWHLPSAIINLQERFLETQADMFENGDEALKTLMQYLPSKDVEANGV